MPLHGDLPYDPMFYVPAADEAYARAEMKALAALQELAASAVAAGVDLLPVPVRPCDRLLLCSDGLTDLVPDPIIAELLRTEDPQSAAAMLGQAALAAGGRDNVTAVVLDVIEGPVVPGDGQVLGAVADLANVVDPGAVRLLH